MKNTPKSHPIFAAFCDFYFLATVFMAALGVFTLLAQKILFTVPVALIAFLLTLMVSILYHSIFYKKTKWLSFGERISGRVLMNSKKEWVNPYGKNRWLLFLLIIITLIFLGNDWDALEVNIIPFGVVVGKVIKLFLMFLGMLMLGKGLTKGALILFLVFLVNVIISFLIFMASGISFFLGAALTYGVLMIGYLLVYIFYRVK